MFNRIFRWIVLVALFVFGAMALLGWMLLSGKAGMPAEDVLLWFVLPALGAAGLAFFLCGVAAHLAADRIAKPLNELTLNEPLQIPLYSELRPFEQQLQRLQAEQNRKQEMFDLTTKYMTEGLVLLNAEGKVLSVNDAARRIFRLDGRIEGRDVLFLYPSDTLRKLVHEARDGVHGENTMHIRSLAYQISASPIFQGGQVTGIVLLMFDITQREQAEKMRREFSANVSHELKTPLQTISGCAELLSSGMVKAEDVPRFSEQIYTESRRMITLVEDIIKLSRLDEGDGGPGMERVDLFALARQTAEVLGPAAGEAAVQLEVQGEPCHIMGIAQLLEGIVYNLCENAIKYNVEGGRVLVQVKKEPYTAVLTVSDTGIGIPIHHQQRVFERFYRVDKSHSKKVGGTGLGLSIVKHAVKLHKAEVQLQSEPGKGTTVTVVFPRE